jgi:hypothetical protein
MSENEQTNLGQRGYCANIDCAAQRNVAAPVLSEGVWPCLELFC